MSFTISNNSAAASSNYYLGKNQDLLQTSIKRLASGKKLIAPSDDPGSLSVAMKLNASVSRLAGARNNVQNATSFLEVQDGVLEGAGRIEDVDIASESSNLSKYSILTQAAASMLTQANSTNDVALMLIR